MAKSKRSQLAGNLSLLALSLLLALILAEAAARAWLPPPPTVTVLGNREFETRLGRENRNPRDIKLSTPHPRSELYVWTPTGKRLRASTHVLVENHPVSRRSIEIRTNSLGYRNPEIGQKTRTRVLFLGDSITLGDYLQEGETFVRQVETLSRSTSHPLETINAGVGAVGLEDELAILMESGLATHPDIVALGFYLNDVQPSPGVEPVRVPGPLSGSRLAQYLFQTLSRLHLLLMGEEHPRISRQELERWYREVREKFPPGPGDPVKDPAALNALILRDIWDWGSAWSDGAWRRMRPVFTEFKRQADLHRFSLCLLAFPLREQVVADFLYDQPQRRLKELGKELGVPVLDFLPAMRVDWQRSRQELFYDGCHPTPYGSRMMAEQIAEFLQTEAAGRGRAGSPLEASHPKRKEEIP